LMLRSAVALGCGSGLGWAVELAEFGADTVGVGITGTRARDKDVAEVAEDV